MTKLIIWANRNQVASLSIIFLLMICSAPGLLNLRFTPGFELLRTPDHDDLDEIIQEYGSAEMNTVLIHDEKLFTPDKLSNLKSMVDELEDKAKYMEKVESLFSYKNIHTEEGTLFIEPLLDKLPKTLEKSQIVKERALQSKVIHNKLVFKEGSVTILQLYIEDGISDEQKEAFLESVENTLDSYSTNFKQIKFIGPTKVTSEFTRYLKKDIAITVSIAIIILIFVLTFLMSSFLGACFVLVTGSLSIFIWLGIQGYLNIPITLISALIPSMAFILGATEDMHILSSFQKNIIKLDQNIHDSIEKMALSHGHPLFITSLTTTLGFASIMFHPLKVLFYFGVSATIVFILNPIITCLITPTFLYMIGKAEGNKSQKKTYVFWKSNFKPYIRKLIHHKYKLLALFMFIIALMGSTLRHIKQGEYGIDIFEKKSQIYQTQKISEKLIPGTITSLIKLNTKENKGFYKPANMRALYKIQEEIEKRGMGTLGISDIIFQMHKNLQENRGENFPNSKDLLSQYFLLVDRSDITKLINEDYSESIIWVYSKNKPDEEYLQDIKFLKDIVQQNIPNSWTSEVTGERAVFIKGTESLTKGLMLSILLMLICVFFILSIMFTSIKAGAIGVIVNSFPIVFCYSFLYIFDINLTMATSIIATMALGVAVDDTLHFMALYHFKLKSSDSTEEALQETMATEFRPLFATSISIILFFIFIFLFSSLTTSSHFAIISALAILGAFITDMFLTPIFLITFPFVTLWDYVSSGKVNKVFFQSTLFKNLSQREVRKIISLSKKQYLISNSYLCRQGEKNTSIFVLIKGNIEVTQMTENHQQNNLGNFTVGEAFGELAFVAGGKRQANVVAKSDVEYMEITRKTFDRIMLYSPYLGQKLLINIAKKIASRLTHKKTEST